MDKIKFETNLDKMSDVDLVVCAITDHYLSSPKAALEMGVAILNDRKIILLVDKNLTLKVPKHLITIAVRIVRVDFNDKNDVEKALAEVLA